MTTNTTPSGADATDQQDAKFNEWYYDTKFKAGMERGPLDKYVAQQAWFAALSAAQEDALDAARYRWLVSVCESDGFGYWLPEVCLKEGNLPPSKAESDTAIDAAMKDE